MTTVQLRASPELLSQHRLTVEWETLMSRRDISGAEEVPRESPGNVAGTECYL